MLPPQRKPGVRTTFDLLTGYSPRMKSCNKHFLAWAKYLENRPNPWGVRNVTDGLSFHNKALRDLLDDDVDFAPWEDRVATILPQYREMVENAHSLALKTGKVQLMRFKSQDGSGSVYTGTAQGASCSSCSQGCGIIVSCFDFSQEPRRVPPRSLSSPSQNH